MTMGGPTASFPPFVSQSERLADLAKRLHAHADGIEHSALLGGWLDGEHRHVLSQPDREAWMAAAAAVRAAAYALAGVL